MLWPRARSRQFRKIDLFEIRADLEQVNLAKLPGTERLADRLSGAGSGNLQLKTAGVGREELLRSLDGSGFVNLKQVELNGLDLPASIADGAEHSGTSRWPAGECAFLRSEERRVGKECRSRWSPDH